MTKKFANHSTNLYNAQEILRQGIQHCGDDFQLQYKYEKYISIIIHNVSKQNENFRFFFLKNEKVHCFFLHIYYIFTYITVSRIQRLLE